MKRRRTKTEEASRRAFLKLMAGGTAAALASPALGLAAGADPAPAGAKKPAPAGAVAPAAEIRKGIEEQKGYLAQTVAAIRKYDLPTNSEQAFLFRAMKAPRRTGR